MFDMFKAAIKASLERVFRRTFAHQRAHNESAENVGKRGKTTATTRVAVRETGVFRHHRDPIQGSLKPPVHHRTLLY